MIQARPFVCLSVLGLAAVLFAGACVFEEKTPGAAVSNRAPVANAGPDQQVAAGSAVSLDGSASSDPDRDAITFAWLQTAGPAVSLDDAAVPSPRFAAPVLATETTLTFSLVVNDGTQDSIPDAVDILVLAGNREPVVDGITPASPQTVDEGATLAYTITFFDPDDDLLAFSDNCDSYAYVTCSASGNVVTVEISPPFGTGSATVGVTVTADDGEGGTVDASVGATVNDLNDPPVGEATPAGPYAVAELDSLAVTVGFTDTEEDTISIDTSSCDASAWISCADNGDDTVTVTIAPPGDAGNDVAQVVLVGADATGQTSVTLDVAVVDGAAPAISFAGLSDPPAHVTNAGTTDTSVTLAVDDAPDGDTPYACIVDDAPSYVVYDDSTRTFTFAAEIGDADGTATVTCVDADGSAATATFDVAVNEAPAAAFSFNPDPVPAGNSAELVDGTTDSDPGDTHTCRWSSPTAVLLGPTDSCAGVAVATSDCDESHDVTLIVTDAHGLTGTTTETVTSLSVGPYVAKRVDCSDDACGSRARPWCTIQAALAASANGTAFAEVYVAPSTVSNYNDGSDGPLVLISGVSVFGGYAATDWNAPPARDENPTIIETETPEGVVIDGVNAVTFNGFHLWSVDDGTSDNTDKAVITVRNCGDTVEISNNVIRADDRDPGPPDRTIGVDLSGSIAVVLTGNQIDGGNGSISSTAIRYRPLGPADAFSGTIVDHLESTSNGLDGGSGDDAAGLRLLGTVGETATISNNDISGGSAATLAQGIVFGGVTDHVLGENASLDGGAGQVTIGVAYTGIGDGNTAVIDGARTIAGGAGVTRSIGVLATNPGKLEVRNATIHGGAGPASSTGIWLRGDFAGAAGPLHALLRDSSVEGGAGLTAGGVRATAVADLELRDCTVSGGAGSSTTGIAVALLGPGVARVQNITAIGRVDATVPWQGTGIGLDAAGDVELTLLGSRVYGGEADTGTGISYVLGAAPTGFFIGGSGDGDANTIAGAPVGGNGLPAAGGTTMTGIALGRGANQLTATSRITANVVFGGAPAPSDPGAGGAPPVAIAIRNGGVGNVLIDQNTKLQGCAPCSGVGPTGNTPYGVGIGLSGALVMDGPTTGGIVDNDLIAGGPIAAGATGTAISVGLYVAPDAQTGGTPTAWATGNTLWGNHDVAGVGTRVADAVRVAGGDVRLGAATTGNTRIEGGVALDEAVGVRAAPDVPVAITLVDNTVVAGNISNAAARPTSAYGVCAISSGPVIDLTAEGNAVIWGGLSTGRARGISGSRLRRGPIRGNQIAAGVAVAAGSDAPTESVGLEILSTAGPLTVERNLVEGCGLYDAAASSPAHDPECELVRRSVGARVGGDVAMWNNRVFGGYGRAADSSVGAIGVELLPALAAVTIPATLVAHNIINAQGAEGSTAAAILVEGSSGSVGTGLGWYLVSNILETGATGFTRYHVFERAVAVDFTEMVVLHNTFAPDPGATAVYHEDRWTSGVDYGSGEIISGCKSVAGCLDDDATGQTVLGKSNYDGNVEIDPALGGPMPDLVETPRLLAPNAFCATAAALQSAGYDLDANPFGLPNLTEDFEGDARGSPPDIGHDEQ